MENETVSLLLLLKPMTQTSQINDIAIMIYHGGCPVLETSTPCFFDIILMKITWKRWKMKKETVLSLKPMTKTSQLNGKFKEDVFRRALSPQMAFQDGGLKLSFHELKVSARIICRCFRGNCVQFESRQV